jgi:hypothetical protein
MFVGRPPFSRGSVTVIESSVLTEPSAFWIGMGVPGDRR